MHRTAPAWPDDKHAFVTAAQVAAYLGYADLRAFHRDKPWREAHGFPAQPLKRRWRAWQIEAWEAARIRGEAPAAAPANDAWPVPAAGARQKLDRLRAQLAASE